MGYTSRGFNGPEDYAALAALLNASEGANGCQVLVTTEQMAHSYGHVQRCDLATDLLIVQGPDDLPVAYARVFWDQELDGLRRYGFVCHILPEHRAAITGDMLDWIEQRILDIATEQAYEGPRCFQTWCENEAGMGWMLDELQARGYVPMRYGYPDGSAQKRSHLVVAQCPP